VEIKTGDEIGQLAQEFNKMAGELQTSYSTLEQKVEQRTSELAALYDVTATVNQSLELDTILQEVIKKISGIFHFDTTRIFLFNPQGDELQLRASIETQPEFFTGVRAFPRGQGVVGKVTETGQPLIFEDALTDPRYLELSRTRATKKGGFSFFAVFPIKAKEGCFGVLLLVGKHPRKLALEETRLLNSMAEQIGVAVENATLFQETVARAKELSALYDVAAVINQFLDPDLVLREVCRKVLEVTYFDAARIYLLGPDGKDLTLKAYEGISPELASQMATYSATRGIEGKAVTEGKPVIFEDIQIDPQYAALALTNTAQNAGFRGFIIVPLKAKEKIIGAMDFLTHKAHQFSAREIALFTSMANQIGVALENSVLFEELRTRSQQLAALNAIAATVNRSLELDVVLRESVEKVRELLGFDAAWIYVLDPTAQELHLRAYKGLGDEVVRSMYRREIGAGNMGRVIASGEPLVYEDIQTDPDYHQGSATRRAQSLGFRTLCNFPIKSKQRTLGVLNLANYSCRRFLPDELELIGSIATEIGVGVDNARLFEETRRKSSELEQANIELVEANRAKADFLAAMSHELRTPLNVIIGNADLVRDGMFGDITEKQKSALEKILHYSEILLKLINDVLTLTKMEAQKTSLNVSTFDVGEIIAHAQSFVEHLNRDGHLKVLWEVEPGLPPLTTDALRLEEILQNLIGNAFKFTPEGRIEVRVRDLRGKDRIEFSVADTGIGIENHDLDRIFEQFHQLGEAHTGTYSGVGLGLNIVKRYVEMMEGKIRVESQPGKGSTFTFELPYSI